MDGKWYVVNTKLKKEAFVERQLATHNIHVFCPLVSDLRMDPSGPRKVLTPLFPSYLFARVSEDGEVSTLRWLPGVRRLLGNGDIPVPVDDGVVDFLKSHSDGSNVIRRKRFGKGDRVRVRKGFFKGLIGVVEEDLSPDERVRILIGLVMYQGSLLLHNAMLERA